ncbi:hypothetical protein HL658_03955 [Azospirillum sp. RWY-5-1]|uniref:Helix-turn-helix domain-containing protein n=1 Tax=Azospirillum oleiclasticum TaxID=2735135 RepID=A0ABX2T3L7_9PROT|nr:hypothetical protein [Azospirillum oleiclasticum]NYZ11692.1 hypothetical protein [Azospirillum oleiclasticum]NYZ18853.1 hypothetical protein [Azospirillum oleiclasticum]
MNAETGNEPESPKKRGRIPQTAWPRILERYRAGATLSAIAREFECTPSAISYIVRKAEAAGMLEGEGAPVLDATDASEEAAATTEAQPEPAPAPAPAPAAAAPAPAQAVTPPPRRREGAAPAQATAQPPQNAPGAEPRRTLRIESPAPQPPAAAAPVVPPVSAAPQPPSSAAAPAAQPADPAAAGRSAARPEPTPPVDAVEARLRETARGCLSAYRTWRQTPGESSIQSLSDAVHELRKALARIEIDMSASRREEQAIRPIPIPAHRAARRQ